MGDAAWFCLSSDSQKDLYGAFKQQEMLNAQTNGENADYSPAALYLIQALEREILDALAAGVYRLRPADAGCRFDPASQGFKRKSESRRFAPTAEANPGVL